MRSVWWFSKAPLREGIRQDAATKVSIKDVKVECAFGSANLPRPGLQARGAVGRWHRRLESRRLSMS